MLRVQNCNLIVLANCCNTASGAGTTSINLLTTTYSGMATIYIDSLYNLEHSVQYSYMIM